MKIRDSGMPEESLWATFFDADVILTALGLDDPSANVAEFGCGYGTFTTAVAARTSGKALGFDIEALHGVRNASQGQTARPGQCPLHGARFRSRRHRIAVRLRGIRDALQHPAQRESPRFAAGGKAHSPASWQAGSHLMEPGSHHSPRSDMSIRPSPQQCREWMEEVGLQMTLPCISLPPYHFGLLAENFGFTHAHAPPHPAPHFFRCHSDSIRIFEAPIKKNWLSFFRAAGSIEGLKSSHFEWRTCSFHPPTFIHHTPCSATAK